MSDTIRSDEKAAEVAVNVNNGDGPRPGRYRFNTSFHQYRFIIACLGGYAVGLVLLLRYSISMAIIQMVNQTALYLEEYPNKTANDFIAEGYSPGGEFVWDNQIQQKIMSWYMFAYTLPQLPCTRLALMIGHRKAIPILLTICAISSILTPLVAHISWMWVLILRLIQGVGAAAIGPMQLGLIENWMPFDEIGVGVTCITLIPSAFLPTIPIFIGYLCDIHWSYTFYVPGAITILFCFIWIVFVTDKPDDNWVISDKELNVIQSYQSADNHNHNTDGTTTDTTIKKVMADQTEDNKDNSVVEVKKEEHQTKKEEYQACCFDLFRIPSFYAFLVMWIFHCSAMNNFLFLLPTYLRQFLRIGISLNGTYCSMIQIGSIFAILWVYPFLQILQTSFNLSLTASRRIAYAIVVVMVGGSWLMIGLFHKHQIIILAINRYFHSTTDFLVTGTIISNYAKEGLSSTAYSMINSVGNLTFVATSTIIGHILDLTGSSEEAWSWIFISGCITQFVMLIIYSTMINSNSVIIKRESTTNL